MALSPKSVRTQLNILKPLLGTMSLKSIRKWQDRIGELAEAKHRDRVLVHEHPFPLFQAAWAIPKDERRQGVILYLHGGGYTCGGVEYALGFGSMLASRTGTRVFCPGYRLAPEHRFPAALTDAVESYRYLLEKGYPGRHITLCGESAGGGLCYSLCLRLQTLGLPMPGGIITISPWVDLTASGDSYQTNRDVDPSLTAEHLDFYASCYTDDRQQSLVSPLFADLSGMPPALTFVGGDEILLDDAVRLDRQLKAVGVQSHLVVKPQRWHGYLLYGLSEDNEDFNILDRFLDAHLAKARKLRWMRLDNAAKIYPAARRENWSNVYRLSVTLKEEVDKEVLQSALDVTVRRFPSFAARLRRGVFWYYLEQLERAPVLREEYSHPLAKMSREEMRTCAFRVIVYKKRIALEIFHSLTDGTGGMTFLKTLTAEYLQQKHGIHIGAGDGVLGRLEQPSEEELEDSFQKYAGPLSASRKERDAFRLTGTQEDFLHLTCLRLPVKAVVDKAHAYGVTVTAFLCAAMMDAIARIQRQQIPDPRKRKPVKVLLPVNLRALFPSRTLRNFAMYTTPEMLPQLGEYDFQELCKLVHHRMGTDITPKQMGMKIATNVASERLLAVKLIPLFLKNIIMKAVFDSVGEKKSCLSLSNLGAVQLPEAMQPFVERFDFILGIQATAPYNCGVISYADHLNINIIRNIKESALEASLHQVLKEQGLPVQVQSNG